MGSTLSGWGALCALAVMSCNGAGRPRLVASRGTIVPPRAADARPAAPTLTACPVPQGAAGAARHAGNPEARAAAQRGLAFVGREAAQWQRTHNCYGCHVQAVTFEALTVGRAHQYDVDADTFAEVRRGLLDVRGGHRQPGGLSVGGSGMPASSRAFGGAAFARYDQAGGDELRDDLLAVAQQLIEHQGRDGAQASDDTRFPVVAGPLQATTQALQTWRQAYARSADERWLAPMRRAEAWLQREARALSDSPVPNTVHMNYAVLGLLAAGAQPGEAVMRALAGHLRERQHADGGFGFEAEPASNAFATGQTVHALRELGFTDDDPTVARGTRWLMAHQGDDGGWSHEGRGKAEAMWAVFGLVSIDRLSLSLQGLRDGEHARGRVSLRGDAVDNQGDVVQQLDLRLDDVPLARGCGASVAHDLDLASLAAGVHTLDLVATNARGQSSRRRVSFYTGAHYLVNATAAWEQGVTRITLRDVAPTEVTGRVSAEVRAAEGAATNPLWRNEIASAQGPLEFHWDGHDSAHRALPAGRYVATLRFVDASGRAVQSVEVPFVHDTPEAQQARYAEVAGQLQTDDARGAANTELELVDRQGNVVARTVTTEQGNYRFRNVDSGNYQVRASRRGFRPVSQAVEARAGAPAAAARPMQMQLH
ncbi:MAG: carboxypeptidase regulatory-like domain-containing protein [Polyangiales bacterium]